MLDDAYSLLWSDSSHSSFTLDNGALQDLNIGAVPEVLSYMKTVPCDPKDIRYRQELLGEFVQNQLLFEGIKSAIVTCNELQNRGKFAFEKEATLYNLIKRIEEASDVMVIVEVLLGRLVHGGVQAGGLVKLKDLLEGVIDHPLYGAFKTDVESVKSMSGGVKSIKVGINLDENLKPVSAMLLSLHENNFSYTRLLKKTGKIVTSGVHEILLVPRKVFFPDTIPAPQAFNSLEKMLEPAMKQLILFCDHFIDGLVTTLAALKVELPFYELGLKLHHDLTAAGFSLCLPKVVERGGTVIEGVYNLNLAYEFLKEEKAEASQKMIYNDLSIEDEGNVFILTGANRGGKTTFTQAIGQMFLLGHLGLYVPARCATLRLIDGLLLHFPAEEGQTDQQGRLGDECKRFSDIFEQLTPRSLLLMNESFSGTSHLESLTIASEAVRAVKVLGSTLLFNTHLHELGALTDAINEELGPVPRLISLVAGTREAHQSFYIEEGPPLGQSYAQDIAIKYGMTFEQLTRV